MFSQSSSHGGFGENGSYESPSGQSLEKASWQLTTAVFTPKLACNGESTDYILSNEFKVKTAANSERDSEKQILKKPQGQDLKESAHMSFGNPHVWFEEAFSKCKTRETEKMVESGRKAKSSFHDKAVPGVVNSLDEIELEFEFDKEIDYSLDSQDSFKAPPKLQSTPTGKIEFKKYEISEPDISYTKEDNSMKTWAKPIKWLADVAHFRGNESECKQGSTPSFNFPTPN